jgi:hypothetical protein
MGDMVRTILRRILPTTEYGGRRLPPFDSPELLPPDETEASRHERISSEVVRASEKSKSPQVELEVVDLRE